MAKPGRSDKLTTGEFRASFAHVFEPRPGMKRDDGTISKPRFTLTMMFDKSNPDHMATVDRMKKAAEAAAFDRWPDGPPRNLRSPFKDGDTDVLEISGKLRKEKYPEQAGHIIVEAWSTSRPKVVDQDMNEILDREAFYSGAYGRASVNFYTYGGEGTDRMPGVNCGLLNIQKLKDGKPFGFRSRPEDDFEKVAKEDADWGDSGGESAASKPASGGLFG